MGSHSGWVTLIIVPASSDAPTNMHEVNDAQLNNATIYGHGTYCVDVAIVQLHLGPTHENIRTTPHAILIKIAKIKPSLA